MHAINNLRKIKKVESYTNRLKVIGHLSWNKSSKIKKSTLQLA